LKLGFDVSERSVARYLRRVPRRGDPATRWAAFLANHREAIVACDFFTVPTLTFQLLSCFFVIEHHRRTILHFNVTREPTAAWVVQQLRDVFLGDGPHRFILIDHDSTFDGGVITFLKATGLDPTRTGIQAPWQNGIAERWAGSCRRELLDHIIALNERHLYRLIRAYVAYYHQDRIHDALGKDAPNPSSGGAEAVSTRDGDLHGACGRPSSPVFLAQRSVRARRRSRHCSVLGLRCHRCVTRTRRFRTAFAVRTRSARSCVCGQRSLRRLAGLILVTPLQGLSGKLRLPS
jgi:transposase InsO family protein